MAPASPGRAVTAFLTLLALIAFAANSIFARLALGSQSIDPASYTTVRLVTGAATLWLIARLREADPSATLDSGWTSAAMLFLYAGTFSFAYISLTTGTGALILFAAVQITMIAVGLYAGERPSPMHWLGLLIAVAGLVYLVSPGVTAPSAFGSLLMGTAGIAWGIYSILGRGVSDPVHATARNFLRTVPLTFIISLLWLPSMAITAEGFLWAALSGSITSAVGYVIWYAALRGLTATLAATLQLSVPALAALGGVVLLSEKLTLRLFLAGALILAGVGLAIYGQKK
ncbi:MAG TPA: DMT family transporter [Candidatus Binatia bacterium]